MIVVCKFVERKSAGSGVEVGAQQCEESIPANGSRVDLSTGSYFVEGDPFKQAVEGWGVMNCPILTYYVWVTPAPRHVESPAPPPSEPKPAPILPVSWMKFSIQNTFTAGRTLCGNCHKPHGVGENTWTTFINSHPLCATCAEQMAPEPHRMIQLFDEQRIADYLNNQQKAKGKCLTK